MTKRSKLIAVGLIFAFTLPILVVVFAILFVRLFSCHWPQEIERRGWRVLYSANNGNRFVAICNAGPGQLAIIDSEMTSHGSSTLLIANSEGEEIQSRGKITPITCVGWFIYTHHGGYIYPIDIPPDRRIRVLQMKGIGIGGNLQEVLLDVEVEWSD
jgi:hypothetical protein